MIHSNFRSFPGFMIGEIRYRAGQRFEKHIDHKSRISVILSGHVKESASGRDEFGGCGSIVFKPGDVAHQNIFGDLGSRIFSVVFDESFFDENPDVHISDWQWFHGVDSTAVALSFAQNMLHLEDEEDLYDELVDLYAKISRSNTDLRDQIPPWVRRVHEQIIHEYPTAIRTRDLAENLGVHPVYLARVFRRYYGCSIKDLIRRVRLQYALDELSKGEKSIIQIALEAGFSDQSHLNRVFQASLHMSPGKFRNWVSSS